MQKAHLLNLFNGRVNRFRGTNEPVEYRPEYGFSENWQDSSKVANERNQNLLISASSPGFILAILIMVQKIPFVWYLSVWNLFEMTIEWPIFISGIVCIVLDMGLKVYLCASEEFSIEKNEFRLKDIAYEGVKLIYTDLICLILVGIQISIQSQRTFLVLIDVIVIVFQLARMMEIYGTVSIILLTAQYKHHMNLT